MNDDTQLVTVLTPLYNGALYLSECIESVLKQTYNNFEYFIVNNCSTDNSLDLALKYADKDDRIRVINNTHFVGVIENHNIAFKMVSPESKYCKVVSADDWLYPECISKLVAVAQAKESVAMVGSYQLSGGGGEWKVKWCGLPCDTTVVSGLDICRATLLGGPYVFGCPTSVLYRSDLIRGVDQFYPNLTPQADVSAFYRYLAGSDFGFVHQVLSYERVHDRAVGFHCRQLSTQTPSVIRDLLEYGPLYLTEAELNRSLNRTVAGYYRLMVEGLFHFEGREFWEYHRRRFRELGFPLFGFTLGRLIAWKLAEILLNPLLTLKNACRRVKANAG